VVKAMIPAKTRYEALNMKAVIFSAILMAGILGAFIGIPPLILFGFYGIIVIAPLLYILLKKDFMYGLLLWFPLVLFREAIGVVKLPMLPDVDLYRSMWVFLIFFFLAQTALRERNLLPITMIETMMILFCLICLISMITTGTIYDREQGLVLRTFFSGFVMPFSIFFLGKHIVDSEQKIKKIFRLLLLIGIYLAVTGIFEHFRLTSLVWPRFIMNPNLGVHFKGLVGGRARGPFLQAGVNGTVLGMIFALCVYLIVHESKKSSRIFYSIPIGIVPITIFFTYTRSAWLGFILSLLIVPLFYPRLRKIFFLGLLLLVIIVVINWSNVISSDRSVGGVTSSGPIYQRINLYRASARMFMEKPIFGIGFYNFERFSLRYLRRDLDTPLRQQQGAHDTLVKILVELGLVGIIPILLIYFYIFRHSISLYRYLPSTPFIGKGLVVMFWGASIIYIVNMQLFKMFQHLFPNSVIFLLAGVIVGLNQRVSLIESKRQEKQNFK